MGGRILAGWVTLVGSTPTQAQTLAWSLEPNMWWWFTSWRTSLKHRDVVADPAFQRERLLALEPVSFEHVSGALTAELLEKLYDWDRQLGSL